VRLRSYVTALCIFVAVTSPVAGARDAGQLFPALASAGSPNNVTGPINPLVIYYNVLHYERASLSAVTAPIEPPELAKFLNTPPRALGFLPGSNQNAFDILDGQVSAWVYQARALSAHYQADIRALAAVETAYKSLATEADKTLADTAPHDAPAAIARIVTAATGPAGHGAALARQLGYLIDGTTVKRDPAAPPSCGLDAPTADATNTPVFVEISAACIQGILDKRDTLLTGILRAVIETKPADRITTAQADFLRTQLQSINLTTLAPAGTDTLAYTSDYNTVQTYIALLVALNAQQFELSTGAGTCKPGLGGTKSTITFTATDRFLSGSEATVRHDVLVVTCYPRLATSAGIAYTSLPKTAYSITQSSALLNNGGLPPAPAPTFQSTYRVTSSTQSSHIAGVSLLHLCLCDHPSDGVNAYFSFGFIAPDGEPLGVLGGLSIGFGHTYYLTFGEHYGLDTYLTGTNAVGSLVPALFAPSTAQHWILRPAAALTIGL
jgi:hypothetical protein